MADEFIETTREGYGGRVGGALKGVLVGIVLILGSIPLLWWNEGRAVQTARSLEEGKGMVVAAKAESVNPANENKLVHLTGLATTDTPLRDSMFGIVLKALRLQRDVELYQWIEDQEVIKEDKNVGGTKDTTTKYTYHKEWRSSLVDSSQFRKSLGHENPTVMLYEGRTVDSDKVSVGMFHLPGGMVRSLTSWESLNLIEKGPEFPPHDRYQRTKRSAQYYYWGDDPTNPKVGDSRISFDVVLPHDVSIIAQQIGSTFQPYQTKAGDTLQMVQAGIHSSDAMFQSAMSANTILTWVLRFVGFLLMTIGFYNLLGPFPVLADVIPILGSIISVGVGLFAVVASIFLSSLTIAVAWFFYRPVLSFALIGGAAAIVIIAVVVARKKAAS